MQTEIKTGLVFLGSRLDDEKLFVFRVLSVDEAANTLKVLIHPLAASACWQEDWNLKHTQMGLRQGFYVGIPTNVPKPSALPRTGTILDYPDQIDPKYREHAEKRRQFYADQAFPAFFQAKETDRFSSSKPPVSATPSTRSDNFRQQAEAASKMAFPLPDGAKPIGDGALADCYTMPADYAALELRIMGLLEEETDLRDLQTAEMLTLFDKILALLPIPTDDRMAEHPEWMQQVIPLTAQYVTLAEKLRKRIDGNERLKSAATAAVAAEWYAKMEIPPGYQNHYQDGIRAHNRGVHPDQAPFHQLDQKVTLAWLRGWTAARRANEKPTTHDEAQS